ncbi:Gfo/Idh/MocA family protein [Streptomyces olindensis]|uniref:Gfo/Idh/MocA family protein n=1 Tax=Streptomyces olindensis TaxID=358823 RepID=UPI00367E73EF
MKSRMRRRGGMCMSAESLRVGLVGCGEHGAGTLLPTLASLGRTPVAVCDLDREKAHTAAELFRIPAAYDSTSAMFRAEDLDAVVLAGPPSMHVEALSLAADHRVHAFVEKPPAVSLHQVEWLAERFRDAGLVSMVGHNLRHSDAWIGLQALLMRPEFGSVISMSLSYTASGPRGGRWGLGTLDALLLTHAIHALDLVSTCFEKLSLTHAVFHQLCDGSAVLSLTLSAPGDRSAHVIVATGSPRFELNACLVTDAGRVIRVESARTLRYSADTGARTGHPEGLRLEEQWIPRTLDGGFRAAGYERELHAFLAAAAGVREIGPSLDDELTVYRLFDGIRDFVDPQAGVAHINGGPRANRSPLGSSLRKPGDRNHVVQPVSGGPQ